MKYSLKIQCCADDVNSHWFQDIAVQRKIFVKTCTAGSREQKCYSFNEKAKKKQKKKNKIVFDSC